MRSRGRAVPGAAVPAGLTRRALLAGTMALASTGALAVAGERPLFGAIRWDAWYQKTDESVFPQDALAPAASLSRAPVHCVPSADSLTCTGTQAVMDAEIRAAAAAGVDYWAFDWFPPGSSLRLAWELYQSSAIKHLIRWCPIVGLGSLGSPTLNAGEIAAKAAAWAGLMGAPSYLKVSLDGAARPVLFIFYRPDEMKGHFGSLAAMRAGFQGLRAAAVEAGAGNPYIVLFDPALDVALFRASGADAVGNYIARFNIVAGGTFAALDVQVRRYWADMTASGMPAVPIAQLGWDVRPGDDHRMPWDGPAPREPDGRPDYYAIATPQQFADQVAAALRFVDDHPQACPARLVLAYSWDECYEGGCLTPTRGDPDGRMLAALARVLRAP